MKVSVILPFLLALSSATCKSRNAGNRLAAAQDAKRKQDLSMCYGLETVKIPKVKGSSDSFLYHYLFDPVQGAPATSGMTVVALPGGPGSSNIARLKDIRPFVPETYNLLLIDARGTGCNSDANLSGNDFSSYNHAYDVFQVISTLQKRGQMDKFILLGQSYGTVTATILSSILPNSMKPEAVVLEGTLGRAYKRGERWAGYVSRWNQVLKSNPTLIEGAKRPDGKDQLEKLLTAIRTKPKNTFDQWVTGSYTSNYSPTELELSVASNGTITPNLTDTPKAEGFADVINCKEIHGFQDSIEIDEKGRLQITKDSENTCGNIDSLTNRYDSRDYQITAPIYYIQGGEDPATPIKFMEYHRENQRTGGTAIILDDHAHDIFGDMSLWNCLPALWEKILSNKEDLEFKGSTAEFQNKLCSTSAAKSNTHSN